MGGKKRITKTQRNRLAQRDAHCSRYCLTPQLITGERMTIDRIIPEAKGGATIDKNLCLACAGCNKIKGAQTDKRDAVIGRRVRLFNPRRQAWPEHFQWSPDGSLIIGQTACGRATVAALKLNRPELVTARQVWVKTGWWPPKN